MILGRKQVGLMVLGLLVLAASCAREKRQFQTAPPTYKSYEVTMSTLYPGTTAVAAPKNSFEENAYAVSEGKRFFTQYNCTGCHFNGGGGIGPPLMDETWIYGSEPVNVYATVVEGRPNGMPSFRNKIPDNQLWEIVSYVRSLSGQLRKDVAPGRNDDMNAHKSEQSSEKKTPKGVGLPK
jgi:cytochrome c oxidase cbb3-type subunit 3